MSYTANKVAEMVEHANQLQAALTAAAEREETALSLLDSVRRDVTRLETLLADAQQDIRAAAERETKLRAKLDKVVDCFRHMDSNLTNTPWADITPELVMQRAWAVLREENDAKTTAEAEVERLNGELDKLAITLSHEAHARAAERQKVEKLFTWVIEKERQYNLNRGGFITATAVFRQMISLGFIVPGFGLTPDPPRAEP